MSASPSKLVKLTLFVGRKKDLTKEEFEHYWTHVHPKALSEFNEKFGRPICKYTQCHRNQERAVTGSSAMGEVFGKDNELPEQYEAVVEVWFESVESMKRTYTHPLYQEIVSPDEAKFGAGPMQYVVQQEISQWDYT